MRKTLRFSSGFKALSDALRPTMGEPLECEHADPRSGDLLQQTTTGLAYYQPWLNRPVFTNGTEYWTLTQLGLAHAPNEQVLARYPEPYLAGVAQMWSTDEWGEVVRLLTALLGVYPDNGQLLEKLYVAHYNWGVTLRDAGGLAGAIEKLRTAQALDPTRGEAPSQLATLVVDWPEAERP